MEFLWVFFILYYYYYNVQCETDTKFVQHELSRRSSDSAASLKLGGNCGKLNLQIKTESLCLLEIQDHRPYSMLHSCIFIKMIRVVLEILFFTFQWVVFERGAEWVDKVFHSISYRVHYNKETNSIYYIGTLITLPYNSQSKSHNIKSFWAVAFV